MKNHPDGPDLAGFQKAQIDQIKLLKSLNNLRQDGLGVDIEIMHTDKWISVMSFQVGMDVLFTTNLSTTRTALWGDMLEIHDTHCPAYQTHMEDFKELLKTTEPASTME